MNSLDPQLTKLHEEFQALTDRAREIAGRLSPEELLRRPRRESWSVAECIEHLNLTTQAYMPKLEAGIRDLRERGALGNGPYRMEWIARLLRYWLEPPSRIRLRTSTPFQPVSIEAPEKVVAEFIRSQEGLQSMLRQACGLRLDAVRIRSPFAEQMRYNMYSALVLVAAHGRRHLWQAEQAARTNSPAALSA